MDERKSLFLSYAREDAAYVRDLKNRLFQQGYLPFMDETGLAGGQLWLQRLEAEIRGCEVFICLLSRASLASGPCQWEFALAASLGKPILPLLIDPPAANLAANPLKRLQYLNVARLSDAALTSIVRGIHLAQPLPQEFHHELVQIDPLLNAEKPALSAVSPRRASAAQVIAAGGLPGGLVGGVGVLLTLITSLIMGDIGSGNLVAVFFLLTLAGLGVGALGGGLAGLISLWMDRISARGKLHGLLRLALGLLLAVSLLSIGGVLSGLFFGGLAALLFNESAGTLLGQGALLGLIGGAGAGAVLALVDALLPRRGKGALTVIAVCFLAGSAGGLLIALLAGGRNGPPILILMGAGFGLSLGIILSNVHRLLRQRA